MTQLTAGTIATDLNDTGTNRTLAEQGCTIRHIETWHDHDQSCIVWDAPELADADLPF